MLVTLPTGPAAKQQPYQAAMLKTTTLQSDDKPDANSTTKETTSETPKQPCNLHTEAVA